MLFRPGYIRMTHPRKKRLGTALEISGKPGGGARTSARHFVSLEFSPLLHMR